MMYIRLIVVCGPDPKTMFCTFFSFSYKVSLSFGGQTGSWVLCFEKKRLMEIYMGGGGYDEKFVLHNHINYAALFSQPTKKGIKLG